MEYIEQVEKTVDILSFLLSKIPSNIEGKSSWLINSLHVFISELQLHQLSKGFGRIDNSNVDTRQAKHHFWFILLTKGKKSFVTLIFSPGLRICNYCPNMKYGVHRTGGAKVPHIWRLLSKSRLFTSIKLTNSTCVE